MTTVAGDWQARGDDHSTVGQGGMAAGNRVSISRSEILSLRGVPPDTRDGHQDLHTPEIQVVHTASHTH